MALCGQARGGYQASRNHTCPRRLRNSHHGTSRSHPPERKRHGWVQSARAKSADEALRLLEDAHRLQEAGCFALVLEGIPAELAAQATETLNIPTIGIGAGPGCSGQVLVFHDVLRLTEGIVPKFSRTYADSFQHLQKALSHWAADVRSAALPAPQEC